MILGVAIPETSPPEKWICNWGWSDGCRSTGSPICRQSVALHLPWRMPHAVLRMFRKARAEWQAEGSKRLAPID